MCPLTDKEKEFMLSTNLKTYKEIADYLHRDRSSVRRFLLKNGITKNKRNNFKPTQDDINYIKENYMHMNSRDIAEKLGCSMSYVNKIGKEVSGGNKKYRRYYFNEDYFKNITTYKQAYWLGFIMADGCVYSRDQHESLMHIGLSINDKEHLYKFKESIESTHPIKTYKRKDGREYCSINLVSDELCNDLRKYGCYENKTGKIKMPKFNNNELTWGFIHGYIDGDGSIAISNEGNYNTYRLQIVGNLELLESINEFTSSFNIFGRIKEDNRDYSFKFYSLTYQRMEFLNAIFDNTYNKDIIYLDRKKKRVEKFYDEKYDKNKEYYNLTNKIKIIK